MYTSTILSGLVLAAGASAACDRATILGHAAKYMAAQAAGSTAELSKLFSSSFTYQQNNKKADLATGLLSKALVLDHNRTIADTTQCATYTELVATGGPYVIGTQIRYTEDGSAINMVDTVVATTGSWFFNAKTTLGYIKGEDWGTLAEADRSPRATLQKAADDYLDMWSSSTAKAAVPWGNPCTRTEGSMHFTPDCRAGAPNGGNIKNSGRRYVIDETVGSCDVLLAFGGSMPDSHEFRLVKGKLVLVHTITV